MTVRLPAPPPWIDGLPRDPRGYPVPAESGWERGAPVLAQTDVRRKVALSMRRACSVCGYRMRRESHVFRAFGHVDAQQIRVREREVAIGRAGPAHRSCMVYSAMACPFLREPNAKLGKNNTADPGAGRGSDAAVMGFEDYGLLVYGRRHPLLSPSHLSPQFAFLNLAVDVRFEDGDDLQDLLDEAVEADSVLVNSTVPRLYWTDHPADLADLTTISKIDVTSIIKSDPAFTVELKGEPYIAIRL